MLSKRLLLVGLFTLSYLALAMALAVLNWNYEFIYYGVVMLALIALVMLMDLNVRFSVLVLWGLSIWGLVHLCGGTIPVPERFLEPGTSNTLYNLRLVPWLPKYDQVVHAFGFGVSTLASWEALAAHIRSMGSRLRPTIGPLLCVVLMGMGLGAMNEVVEFIATRVMPGTNVGGYDNTGWDLVSNLVGCTTVAAFIWIRERGRDGPER
jgi:putative membrane protein